MTWQARHAIEIAQRHGWVVHYEDREGAYLYHTGRDGLSYCIRVSRTGIVRNGY